jgi:hypothetical protein
MSTMGRRPFAGTRPEDSIGSRPQYIVGTHSPDVTEPILDVIRDAESGSRMLRDSRSGMEPGCQSVRANWSRHRSSHAVAKAQAVKASTTLRSRSLSGVGGHSEGTTLSHS